MPSICWQFGRGPSVVGGVPAHRYGVGGEYPMAAGSAAERAETGGKMAARKRGRAVVLIFSMQGVGNFMK